METPESCPLCGCMTSSVFCLCKDHMVSGQLFHVKQCSDCALFYTGPRPNKLKISDYYKSDAYISHVEEGNSLFEKLYRLVRNTMLKQKLRLLRAYLQTGGYAEVNSTAERKGVTEPAGHRPDHASGVTEPAGHRPDHGSGQPEPGRQSPGPAESIPETFGKAALLDIGCGTGAFIQAARRQGYSVKGYEPQERARLAAISKGLDVTGEEEGLDQMPGSSFQTITMWHVLEHIHDLKPMLDQIDRLLAPGGTLFVAVPVRNAFDAVFYGEYWAAWDVPRHLYHFDRKTIRMVFEPKGFTCLGRRGLPFDSFYVSLLSEKYRNTLPAGFRHIRAMLIGMASNILGITGLKPWSSEVYIFRKQG